MSLDPLPIAIVTLAFLLAGLVKGVVGLGLPPVAMGLLTLVMAPVEAAALLIVPAFVTNVWQLATGPSLGPLMRRLWPMLTCTILATFAGAEILQGDSSRQVGAVLGLALLVYGLLGLAAVRFAVSPRAEPWVGPIAGLLTGLVTGATGVSSIPSAPYLSALGLARDELIQALGLSFTVSTIALGLALWIGGSFGIGAAGASLLTLVPAVAGMVAGGWVRGRVSDTVFRRCFFAGLAALGAHLALRPFL